MYQLRSAGTEHGPHRLEARAGGDHSDDGHIQPLRQTAEGRRRSLWRAIIPDPLEQVGRKGVRDLVGGRPPLP